MNIAIIGAGLIGKKRVQALKKIKGIRVAGVCDVNIQAAQELALEYGARIFTSWKEVVRDSAIDAVVIATSHNWLAPIAFAAVKNRKHVLIEKPGATKSKDLVAILREAKKNKVFVWVGFNHRFHPAALKIKELLKKKVIGDVMYIRAVYGHGGRKGYDKEWRANPKLSGGGELLDQGSHLIDLTHYFLHEPLELKHAELKTYFWSMPVEDNSFLVFESKKGTVAFFHASWTQWKNKFLYEVFGTKGAFVWNGLGGSYGSETLTLYLRPPQGGAPKEKIWIFDGLDESFYRETKEFVTHTRAKRREYSSIEDAIEDLKMVEAIYRRS